MLFNVYLSYYPIQIQVSSYVHILTIVLFIKMLCFLAAQAESRGLRQRLQDQVRINFTLTPIISPARFVAKAARLC